MKSQRPESPSLATVVQGLLGGGSVHAPLRVGATGHRALEETVERWVGSELDGLFSHLVGLSAGSKRPRAVCSLALGADQLFAEVALRHGVSVDVVLPFTGFTEDFREGPERGAYERLLSKADSATCLPWSGRSNGAYLAGGLWVVDHCDLLIAIWNGEKAAGVGGTGDVVVYCRDMGKACVHMHTVKLRIEVLT